MNLPLRTQVYEFLYRTFPGSTLDDGYYFVHVKAPVSRRVHRDTANSVFAKLVDAPSWLVTVNTDPSSFVQAAQIEQGPTNYNPDWNHSETMPQWIAELSANPTVDLEGLRKSIKPVGALAVISARHRVIFDMRYMLVHGASRLDLDTFIGSSEAFFDVEEQLGS